MKVFADNKMNVQTTNVMLKMLNVIKTISPLPTMFLKASYLNPFSNKPRFLRVCSTSLLKTKLGKGEIAHEEQFLLFPTVFFYPFGELSAISSNLKFSTATSFSLEESKICCLGNG